MSLIISYETARCQCDRKIDFGNGVSTISNERVKCSRTHNACRARAQPAAKPLVT
jgi:hypothetical protein